MKTLNLFILLAIFCSYFSYGQGEWTNYSKDDGLASTWVRDCIEDAQGNLWFTTDKGLNRFDGTEMEVFTKKDGLPLETLMQIFIDKNGIIWFTIEPPNHNIIGSLVGGASGAVLESLTKRGNGWGRYDGSEIIASMNNKSSEYLMSHIANVDGEIWIGGVGRKNKEGYFMFDFDGKSFNTVTRLGGADLSTVNYFYSKGKEDIWFSSQAENGDFICHFDGENLISYGTKDGLPSENMYKFINTIFEDSNRNIWFGASFEAKYGGLMKFDGASWTIYNEDNGIIGKCINQIVEDKDKNIWVATNKAVNVFDGSSWKNYTDKDKLPDNYITEITVDSKGRVWIGTMSGLVLFDHGEWSTIDKKNGLTHNAVRKIFEDSKGNIWVGAASTWKWGGISIYDGNNWKPLDFSDVYANKFFEDSKGNIWVLSLGKGVFKFEF